MATAKYRRRKKNKIYPNYSSNLPRELTITILSKLGCKTILCCKAVCKEWYDIVTSDPNFARTNYENNSLALVFSKIVMDSYQEYGPSRFYGMVALGGSWDGFCVVNSCKGFLLMMDCSKETGGSCVVYNPLTNETVFIPNNHISYPWRTKKYNCALGYSPVRKQLKVVLFCKDVEQDIYCVQICTLGDSTTDAWRTVFPSKDHGNIIEIVRHDAIELNGFLHWKPIKDRILCLDMDREEFGEISFPDIRKSRKYCVSSIGVYAGLLCLRINNLEQVEMWVMKEYGIDESWMLFVAVSLGSHLIHSYFSWDVKGYFSKLVETVDNAQNIYLSNHSLTSTINGQFFYNASKKWCENLFLKFSNSIIYAYTPSFFSLKNLAL